MPEQSAIYNLQSAIEIISAGPLMTVQDIGRPGARRYGVSPGGALDPFALAAANELVGNPLAAAGVEITAGGARLLMQRSMIIALAGADLGARLDGRPIPLWTAVFVSAGATLTLEGRRHAWGARAYLAVAGGVGVPLVLGSRATDLAGGFGGMDGRPLRASDQLPLGDTAASLVPLIGQRWPESARPPYCAEPRLRIIPGPHLECFASDALSTLAAATLRVSDTSNRMGYRLEGLRLPYARPCSLPSLGVIPGTIQVPPDGAPILLMADAQTTGGYPVIGALISADMPLAAQLLPGDTLRMRPTTLDEAYDALGAQAAALSRRPDPGEGDLLAALAGG
ncbi:biotin-dependent carboxyltransferase family protein [Oscillochloris sp. ZM17-4]|uniref:5-oxoprolinase subunit C family protein n=1 Tax=Oscillochloris sp. ZM17-4 TaxID=2866714 RepID=UPI001C72FC3F|nr:biotin-dependent carboxyltransferase family protein [Oscillochloris sp. ZM17-4]MBX0326983.1 biotin-dependent carboxyltransferase family protein [Oscillochloris sp. ZM17-4]